MLNKLLKLKYKFTMMLSTSPEDFHKTNTTPSVTNRLTSEAGLDTMGHFIVDQR